MSLPSKPQSRNHRLWLVTKTKIVVGGISGQQNGCHPRCDFGSGGPHHALGNGVVTPATACALWLGGRLAGLGAGGAGRSQWPLPPRCQPRPPARSRSRLRRAGCRCAVAEPGTWQSRDRCELRASLPASRGTRRGGWGRRVKGLGRGRAGWRGTPVGAGRRLRTRPGWMREGIHGVPAAATARTQGLTATWPGSPSAQQVGGDGRCGAGKRQGKSRGAGQVACPAAGDPPCSALWGPQQQGVDVALGCQKFPGLPRKEGKPALGAFAFSQETSVCTFIYFLILPPYTPAG